MTHSFYENIVNPFFPARCPYCESLLNREEIRRGACRVCAPKVPRIGSAVCLRCGKELKDPGREFCGDCSRRRHEFDQTRAIFVYRDFIKPAMYRFKYSNRGCYARLWAREAREQLGHWLDRTRPQVIVPVPMYGKKKRQRGYNQAEVFARALGRELGLAVDTKMVIRCKNTTPMKGLEGSKRKKNLQNAFIVRQNRVKSDILLVDDIYTTGATMDGVALALKDAGAQRVYGLCICTGRDWEV